MYWTKNSSNLLMSSLLAYEIMCHICVELMGCNQGRAPKDGLKGREGAGNVQDEAVDLQHGIRVDGDSHSCVKGHYLK